MSKAVGTRGSFASQAGHQRLRKYQLMAIGGMWKARVPYGTWRIFETWEEGRAWLAGRHETRTRA